MISKTKQKDIRQVAEAFKMMIMITIFCLYGLDGSHFCVADTIYQQWNKPISS